MYNRGMARYRIFTNDRGTSRGVTKYSCLKQIEANSEDAAVKMVDRCFGPPSFAPIKAIRWPATEAADQEWLRKHV